MSVTNCDNSFMHGTLVVVVSKPTITFRNTFKVATIFFFLLTGMLTNALGLYEEFSSQKLTSIDLLLFYSTYSRATGNVLYSRG